MQAGTRFTYPVDLIAPEPEVKLATFQSRVRRPTTAPPRQPNKPNFVMDRTDQSSHHERWEVGFNLWLVRNGDLFLDIAQHWDSAPVNCLWTDH